jgi:acyl carrier protein
MIESIEHWLSKWFEEKEGHSAPNKHSDFYDSGQIDSFGIIELIGDIEDRFGVFFTDDDFRQDYFRTIAGLARLIRVRQASV